jgi:hypothetical protein
MHYTNFDPEFIEDGTFQLVSTSNQSAAASVIELRDTSDQYRYYFEPMVVENKEQPRNAVRGKLVYEKKGKYDPCFPTEQSERISMNDVRKGDSIELVLRSEETRRLYDSLTELYRLAGGIEKLPSGTATYVQVEGAAKHLLELLRMNPSAARMIADRDTFDLVKELVKLLTQGTSHEELGRVLSELEQGNLNNLSTRLNLETLNRAAREMRDHMGSASEQYWQSAILEKYPWIISQIFSTPCAVFGSKAYVGGKTIRNRSGNVADFLFQNKLTGNVALVEIKKPDTHLLGSHYRERSYSLSPELSGAVSQVLSYRHSLVKDLARLQSDSGDSFEAFSPRCVVIIGSTREFDRYAIGDRTDAIGSFENFRNSLNGVTIVTFDELLQKVEDLIAVLTNED